MLPLRMTLSFLTFGFIFLPVPGFSSGCGDPTKIPVQIPSDKKCWFYSGLGTDFEISANTGETVYARMIDIDGKPLSPIAHGPNNFIHIQETAGNFDENGELEFKAPVAGKYTIQLGPCAVWGESVKVQVCKK